MSGEVEMQLLQQAKQLDQQGRKASAWPAQPGGLLKGLPGRTCAGGRTNPGSPLEIRWLPPLMADDELAPD